MTYFGRVLLVPLAVALICQTVVAQSSGDIEDQIVSLPPIHRATRLDRAAPRGSIGVGAMPVAAERILRRSAPRPLPMHTNRWKSVTSTFDPDRPLESYLDLEPNGYPKGNLEGHISRAAYDDYVARARMKELESGPVSDYEMHNWVDPVGDGYNGPDYSGDSPSGDLWDYYHNVNHRWWARGDFLYWRMRGYDTPPLVTQSPAGTNLNVAGVLGQSTTTTLFPTENLASDDRNGGRLRVGWWAVDGQFLGYQAEYFTFGSDETNFLASSTAAGAILARPFFNNDPGTNAEDAALLSGTGVSFDGVITYDVDGVVKVDAKSDMTSAGFLRRHVLWADFDRNYRVDYLIGYRYIQLDEMLSISDTLTLNNPSGGTLPAGTLVRRTDRFDTQNDFHGGEVGLMGEVHRGRWSLEAVGKIAVGNTRQVVDVNGSLEQNISGSGSFVPTAGAGGLLAQPGLNGGRRRRDVFTLIPEAELNLVFQINSSLRLTFGYNALYITHVVRPGDQIDRNLNPTHFPPGATPNGPATPQAQFNDSYFWLNGFSGGLEARW